MRNVLVLIWLVALLTAAFAQTESWHKYTVPETGATVDLPVAIFAKDAGSPETGYGRRFTTADGRAALAVQSMTNEANESPASFLAKKHPPSNIATAELRRDFS